MCTTFTVSNSISCSIVPERRASARKNLREEQVQEEQVQQVVPERRTSARRKCKKIVLVDTIRRALSPPSSPLLKSRMGAASLRPRLQASENKLSSIKSVRANNSNFQEMRAQDKNTGLCLCTLHLSWRFPESIGDQDSRYQLNSNSERNFQVPTKLKETKDNKINI